MNRDLFEEFLNHHDEIFCVSSRPSPQVIRPRTNLLEHGFARKLKTPLSDDWDHVGIQALCLEELQGKVNILEATVGAHYQHRLCARQKILCSAQHVPSL